MNWVKYFYYSHVPEQHFVPSTPVRLRRNITMEGTAVEGPKLITNYSYTVPNKLRFYVIGETPDNLINDHMQVDFHNYNCIYMNSNALVSTHTHYCRSCGTYNKNTELLVQRRLKLKCHTSIRLTKFSFLIAD